MEYTIIVNDRSYDLPKKTLAVAEKLDAVLKVDALGIPVRQKFEKLHSFMKDMVGTEETAEMFGSGNLAEIDLSEVTLAVRKVIDAYDMPLKNFESEKMARSLDDLPIDKIIAMTKAAEKIVAMPADR